MIHARPTMSFLTRRVFILSHHARSNITSMSAYSRITMRSLWTGLLKSLSTKLLKPAPKLPEEPRSLPTSGFHTVDPDRLVEEEELPDYKADRFYPVHLGEIFEERYQVLGKLGFGSSSTVWLARDLK